MGIIQRILFKSITSVASYQGEIKTVIELGYARTIDIHDGTKFKTGCSLSSYATTTRRSSGVSVQFTAAFLAAEKEAAVSASSWLTIDTSALVGNMQAAVDASHSSLSVPTVGTVAEPAPMTQDDSCPSNTKTGLECSRKGLCFQGMCQCFAGYFGSVCTISTPPTPAPTVRGDGGLPTKLIAVVVVLVLFCCLSVACYWFCCRSTPLYDTKNANGVPEQPVSYLPLGEMSPGPEVTSDMELVDSWGAPRNRDTTFM